MSSITGSAIDRLRDAVIAAIHDATGAWIAAALPAHSEDFCVTVSERVFALE